jgi:hypothetical protein
VGYLILPLTKGPHGRIRPTERQDWWKGCQKVLQLQQKLQPSKIYVISNVKVAGEEAEADTYVNALKKLGARDDVIVVIREAQETTKQLAIASQVAKKENLELVVVSTALHHPRVRWICWWDEIEARHYVAWGLPRPGEAIRDVALWVIFPCIDVFGKRKEFLEYVEKRRISGKH